MSDPDFSKDTIAVLGVGLIGGSLALAFKRAGIGNRIIGVSRQETIDRAVDQNVIDAGFTYEDLESAVEQADYVFLCTPISRILELLPSCLDGVKPGCVVTDVGSTKRTVVEAAGAHPRSDVSFITGIRWLARSGKGWTLPTRFCFRTRSMC